MIVIIVSQLQHCTAHVSNWCAQHNADKTQLTTAMLSSGLNTHTFPKGRSCQQDLFSTSNLRTVWLLLAVAYLWLPITARVIYKLCFVISFRGSNSATCWRTLQTSCAVTVIAAWSVLCAPVNGDQTNQRIGDGAFTVTASFTWNRFWHNLNCCTALQL